MLGYHINALFINEMKGGRYHFDETRNICVTQLQSSKHMFVLVFSIDIAVQWHIEMLKAVEVIKVS